MSTNLRSRIYIAGPISAGDPVANCQKAIQVGFTLMDFGYAPFVPHYSYFVDIASTHGEGRYEQWLALDFSFISTCHALLRLPGLSKGADREVIFARERGIPVFDDILPLLLEIPATQMGDSYESYRKFFALVPHACWVCGVTVWFEYGYHLRTNTLDVKLCERCYPRDQVGI